MNRASYSCLSKIYDALGDKEVTLGKGSLRLCCGLYVTCNWVSMGGNKLPDLKGYVCLVTGASRGIGRGIALALGACGATVYITGRTLKPKGDVKEGDVGGSLEETAADVTSRGGVAIPVAVDHSDDSQVVNLFSRIRREQKGRLDLLVNNAFTAAGYISSHHGVSYWELEAGDSASTAWDIVNRVGLRNHYICATLATRMMLECRGELTTESGDCEIESKASSQHPGLIINISSLGGLQYLFNVPYGVGKAAVDRMASDMAHELREKKKSIAVISLWPGMVKTEHMLQSAQKFSAEPTTLEKLGESPELTGFVVAHLLAEPKEQLLSRSGRVVFVADSALQMGIRDTNGKWPISLRSVRFLLEVTGWTRLSRFVPEFVRLPYSVFTWIGSKF
ncbi:hypothetical protein SprV_0702423000 [Sparganum proliferum]